jgi:error-prone DNA polymerase
LVKGLSEATAQRIVAAREQQGFTTVDDVIRRARLRKDEAEALAEAGAFEGLIEERRQALWRARAPRVGGLFENLLVAEPAVELPPLRAKERLLLDYRHKGVSVGDHPMRHMRERLASRRVLRARELLATKQGQIVSVAGVVICRQQPGTASGVVFITLEDETGFCNLVLWNHVYQKFRLPARHSAILLATGSIERQVSKAGEPMDDSADSPVIHVIVRSLERLDIPGRDIDHASRDFH